MVMVMVISTLVTMPATVLVTVLMVNLEPPVLVVASEVGAALIEHEGYHTCVDMQIRNCVECLGAR